MTVVSIVNNIGLIYADFEDWARAKEFYEGALELFRRTNYKIGEREVLRNLESAVRTKKET